MKKYNTVLLDLDGTISNTYSGIVKCLGDACAKYGANLADYDVRKFIGPPLSSTFAVIFPGDERRQKEALTYYRERYLKDGIYDNEMYDGIDDFAEGLRKMGVTVGVATSKYEKYAVEVLRKLGMLEHVDFVCGWLQENLPQVRAVAPEASFLIWLDCRRLGLPQKKLVDLFVNKARLALNDGSMFGAEGEGYMRLNAGCPRIKLAAALERLAAAVKSL